MRNIYLTKFQVTYKVDGKVDTTNVKGEDTRSAAFTFRQKKWAKFAQVIGIKKVEDKKAGF